MPNQFSTPNEVIVTKTADYTVESGVSVVLVDTTAGNITITLPSAAGVYAGYPYTSTQGDVMIVNTGTTGYSVLVAVASGSLRGNTILAQANQAVRYTSDGISTWYSFGARQNTFEVQKSLAAADILGMRTTPVTVVPAPGANKIVVVESMILKMVRTSTAFASGGAVEYRYTDGSGAKVTADMSASLVTGAAGTAYAICAGVVTELTPVANAAIVITNATAAFTTGTGTGVVTCKYRIVTP